MPLMGCVPAAPAEKYEKVGGGKRGWGQQDDGRNESNIKFRTHKREELRQELSLLMNLVKPVPVEQTLESLQRVLLFGGGGGEWSRGCSSGAVEAVESRVW